VENYDQSHIEKKYFVDSYRYNCPFCNIRNVEYKRYDYGEFDWSPEQSCFYHIIECSHCDSKSLHLSYYNLAASYGRFDLPPSEIIKENEKNVRKNILKNEEPIELDEAFFYHRPTSFFIIDNRIPQIIRELISEAEGCLKMNYLTGASACMRKAIYELTVIEKCTGDDHEKKIKSLKDKHPAIDPTLIDVLSHIQSMTSDKIHEQSWDEWDSPTLTLIIETLKSVLYEIYVDPMKRKGRVSKVAKLREKITKKRMKNNN